MRMKVKHSPKITFLIWRSLTLELLIIFLSSLNILSKVDETNRMLWIKRTKEINQSDKR